jgi:hypothetical protein
MAGADRMTIEEVVRDVMVPEHSDLLRAAVEAVCAELMEGEVSQLVGAERGERRPDDRATHRNGYRPRRWDTRAGEIELQIPKIRQGSCSTGTTSLPGWGRASGARAPREGPSPNAGAGAKPRSRRCRFCSRGRGAAGPEPRFRRTLGAVGIRR